MKSPEISVIVPLYREFRWLKEALQSLLDSSFVDWEVILVNDGSPEDPKPTLTPFLKDPRFHYLEKAHEGSAAARNFGIRSALGEWIAFLDQDDRMLPGRFAVQLACAKDQVKDIAGIYSDYERMDESGEILDRYISRGVPAELFVQESLAERGLVAIGTALIHKRWIDQVGGFDTEISGYEETDLVLRISLNGGKFTYLPGVVHQWRNHPSNTMKSSGFQEERRLRFLAKIESLSAQHPVLIPVLAGFRARTWYKIGLYHAEAGSWKLAQDWNWRAWKQDPRRWSALYLAAKAWIKSR